ncbi:MAG: PDZ domain-containing protein [Gammaproteobacteria bacterium]|nr:PDZ domain-containing protein [Gammaproteobacteria bacterium]
MQTIIRWAAVATLAMTATAVFAGHHEGPKDQKEIAANWVKSSCGELAPFIAYVEKHMADDGEFMPARYVGFGFQLDSDPEDEMRVVMVTPDTPASKVLQEGDVFVSVNGVPANFENRDKMTFRGKPGEPVPAVILRDGKEMEIEVNRGVIEAVNDKERALMGLKVADADDWPSDSCSVVEVVAEGNVVYVHLEQSDTEAETGYKFKQRNVTRFEFNEAGQVSQLWGLGEDRFVLEQLGYTISR